MKTALLLLSLLVSHASAIQLKDLIGSWSGQRTVTLNGIGTQSKVTAEIAPRAGGVIIEARGESPSYGQYSARQVFTKEGKFLETVTALNYIVSSSKGTWKVKNGVIQIVASGGNLGGKIGIAGSIQTYGKNRIKYRGTSNGSKVSFNIRRL